MDRTDTLRMERRPDAEEAEAADAAPLAGPAAGAPAAALDREVAFDQLVSEHRSALVRSVGYVVGDRDLAEEVVQDALGKAYASWRRVGRYDAPVAWVRTVAVRDAIRATNRERRRPGLEASVGGRDEVAAPDVAVGLDLRVAIDALPPKQRAAVVLHYLDDLPVTEVARALGCRPSTAKVHLHRARATLASLLGEDLA